MFSACVKSVRRTNPIQAAFKLLLLSMLLLVIGCASKPGISSAVSWDKLKGWEGESHRQLLPPLLVQCPKLEKKQPNWKALCDKARLLTNADNQQIKAYFQQQFTPYKINGLAGASSGLITGYYEPLLKGSYTQSDRYNYPLYKKPASLLKVQPTDNLLKVKDNRARGRKQQGKIVPFYSRAQIDAPDAPLKGNELLWVDSSDDAFFLHIQGSGLVELEDGSVVGVGYAGQNGHPYRAIGRDLVAMQAIAKADISLQSIKTWLKEHRSQAQWLKNKNPSYIFFTLREKIEHGPRGSLNVPLTPERSVAVDRRIIPLGSPLWLDTKLPQSDTPYRRIVFAQDTGGAINGPIRADIFFGRGARAKALAGTMKQQGSIFILLPKTDK